MILHSYPEASIRRNACKVLPRFLFPEKDYRLKYLASLIHSCLFTSLFTLSFFNDTLCEPIMGYDFPMCLSGNRHPVPFKSAIALNHRSSARGVSSRKSLLSVTSSDSEPGGYKTPWLPIGRRSYASLSLPVIKRHFLYGNGSWLLS